MVQNYRKNQIFLFSPESISKRDFYEFRIIPNYSILCAQDFINLEKLEKMVTGTLPIWEKKLNLLNDTAPLIVSELVEEIC